MRQALPRAKGAEVFTRRRPARDMAPSVVWIPVSTEPERVPAGDVDGPAGAGEWAYRVRFALAGAPGAVTTVLVQPRESMWSQPGRGYYRVVVWYSYRLGELSNPGGGAEPPGEPRFRTAAAAEAWARDLAWAMIRQPPAKTAATWDFLQFWDGSTGALEWMEEERRTEMEDGEMSPVCEGDESRPGIIKVGYLRVEDGILRIDEWVIEDPTRVNGTPLTGWNIFFGRSVRELHELAHGTGCQCPVYGFTPSDGEITLAYDSAVPYTWAT